MSASIRKFPDSRQAAEACGDFILELLRAAIHASGTATLAISGGSSPKTMFAAWADAAFPWEKLQLFWVDERVVPPTDAQSNFKMANDAWLVPSKFPAANIHRVEAELGPEPAAARYREEIRKSFGLGPGSLPAFDVVHRGMGLDGHTASLFPGEPLIDDRTGIASAVRVEKLKQWRVTLLPGVLLAARHTALLVTGADKAPVLRDVLSGPEDFRRLPVQIATREHDNAVWFVDNEASAGL